VSIRRALVTGGARGLGAAAAERLRADGLEVVTLDLSGGDLDVDVRDAATVDLAVAEAGPIDVLVNSAGVSARDARLWESTDDEWQRVFDVNVFGTVRMCRAVVPGMRERGWGRIVNFASHAALVGNPGMSAYSASKAAVIALTRSLGRELAGDGVLVNAITPALFDTTLTEGFGAARRAEISGLIPMGRIGRPEEVAELVAWLSSDKLSFSTAAVYDISGGRSGS